MLSEDEIRNMFNYLFLIPKKSKAFNEAKFPKPISKILIDIS